MMKFLNLWWIKLLFSFGILVSMVTEMYIIGLILLVVRLTVASINFKNNYGMGR